MVTFLPLARGSTPTELVETSLGSYGSPPSERVDLLPWIAWSTVWITSLGSCGSPSLSVWMVALGSRGSPPFNRMDGLPQSLGACGCALGHTDGLAPSITARLPGVVAQRVHAAAGTCIIDKHKARGRQRAGATQRGETTSVCASLFQCFVAEVSRGGVLKPQTIFGPQLFKGINNFLSQLLDSLGKNRQFDLQGAKKISTLQSRIFIKKGI
jgi:hypothetical protein